MVASSSACSPGFITTKKELLSAARSFYHLSFPPSPDQARLGHKSVFWRLFLDVFCFNLSSVLGEGEEHDPLIISLLFRSISI